MHLQEYLDSRTDDDPALFVTLRSPHKRIQIGGIEHRLREMGKRLSIPKVHPHKFRRTLATMAIDARVSTDHEEQKSSYEAQVSYYTDYIQSRDDMEFVGVYADEGITGCNTRYRDGFKAMIADALAGKIQLIITKSVSRFARNTVDSLTTIRRLKEAGVEVYFEKDYTTNFKTE